MSRRDELALMDYLEHIHQAVTRIQSYLIGLDVRPSWQARRSRTR